jgi:hypothetical protein
MTITELTVKVSKARLLEALKRNRDDHVVKYNEAMTGYVVAVRKELQEKLDALTRGKKVSPYSKHHEPESHLDDYDTVIGMLDMAGDDAIELTQRDYIQYVKDEWGWKQQWTASNTGYMSGG